MIKDTIKQYIEKAKQITASTKEEIENARIEYLGKKGVMNDLFAEFKNVAPEERKEIGILLNELKTTVQEKIDSLKETIAEKQEAMKPKEDLTDRKSVV